MEKKSLDCILEVLPERIRSPLYHACSMIEMKATEITMRAECPLCIYEGRKRGYLTKNGYLTDSAQSDDLIVTSKKDLEETVLRLCNYSVYAYQHEINSGFITIEGGVRVGLCGKAVLTDGRISNVRDISTLSFRVSRDVKDCAAPLLDLLDPLGGVLICGVPGSGKTTLIRDMARRLSYRYRVSLLDERGELSAFSRGKAGFSLGLCDVYVGYPKGVAAHCAIRSMSPQLIVCDEMGDKSDVDLLLYSLRCGVSFIATVHAASMCDLRSREVTLLLLRTGAFHYVVFLDSQCEPGQIGRIYEMRDAVA